MRAISSGLALITYLSFLLPVLVKANENERYKSDKPTGCLIPPDVSVIQCQTEVKVQITRIVPDGVTCLLQLGPEQRNFTCEVHAKALDLSKRALVVKRAFTAGDLGSGWNQGWDIGNEVLGPVGGVIGGTIGAIVCFIFCDDEPPNTPPYFSTKPTIANSVVRPAKGELSAVVTWTMPIANDKEDGLLTVTSYPYKSGNEFSEGTYVIYFQAQDSEGLPAHTHLVFEVKVTRCAMFQWPDFGNVACDTKDNRYGTVCSVTCDLGYEPPANSDTSIECESHGDWTAVFRDCTPRACSDAPNINNGYLSYDVGGRFYGEAYFVSCSKGYTIEESPLMFCNTSGGWGKPPICIDIMSPRFDDVCPHDILTTIDSVDNTAVVHWAIPTGSDNSGLDPIVTEVHGYEPGQTFEAGAYIVQYTIKDQNNNFGSSCAFLVNVQSISCKPPVLNVDDLERHMRYTCPNMYLIGATCNLACEGGYPLAGGNTIMCGFDINSDPEWQWEGLKPFCQQTNCPPLDPPLYGAIACSEWTYGQTCQMQCQVGHDVPYYTNGQYVCSTTDGLWQPDANVPGCTARYVPGRTRLPSEFFYYTGECNSSTETLLQIQENFVNALNQSAYRAACVGHPDCKAEYVNVTCGPFTARRKRQIVDQDIHRRAVYTNAYIVDFQFVVPFAVPDGQTEADHFYEVENILYEMSDALQPEILSGLFDIPGLTVQSDSLAIGFVDFECPSGMLSRAPSASCVGCSVGKYMSPVTHQCEVCPQGTYQNASNAVECETCPPNTSTVEEGTESLEGCKQICPTGYFSQTGLAPCAACPVDTYQEYVAATSCTACPNNTKTSAVVTNSSTMCLEYDMRVIAGMPLSLERNTSSTDISLLFWVLPSVTTSAEVTVSVKDSSMQNELLVRLYPDLSFELNGGPATAITGTALTPGAWSHITITMASARWTLYINGQQIHDDTNANISTLQNPDTAIAIEGDLLVSSFSLVPTIISTSDLQSASTACGSNIASSLHTMENLSKANRTLVVVPSRCDATDECDSDPCNGHDCVNRVDGFECSCSDGYSGELCDIPPDHCKSHDCKNGATCVNEAANYTCLCPYGFKGQLCQRQAVNGGLSDWTEFGTCSATCAGGMQTRTRSCTNPPPDAEGQPCVGATTESQPCSTLACPECPALKRSTGNIISCEDLDDAKRCNVSCRPGTYFTTRPAQFYQCGKSTNYTWDHVTQDNPRGRLPACSRGLPPSQLSATVNTGFEGIGCTSGNMDSIKSSLEQTLADTSCVNQSRCSYNVVPSCNSASGRKRSTADTVEVSIQFQSDVSSDGSGFNLEDVLQLGADPTTDYINFVVAAATLEQTLQQLSNESSNILEVVIDGVKYLPIINSTNVDTSLTCPPGQIRFAFLCAEVPAGSYSDGTSAILCPRGQYQELAGQSSCTQCPDGFTTDGVGSDNATDCSVEATVTGSADKTGPPDDGKFPLGIILGVCAAVLAVIAVVVAIVIYKCHANKMNSGSRVSLRSARINPIYTEKSFQTDVLGPKKTSFHMDI